MNIYLPIVVGILFIQNNVLASEVPGFQLHLIESYRGVRDSMNEQDEWEDTPLHRAVDFHVYDTVRHLLARGADTDIENFFGETPFRLAVKKKDSHLCDCFIPYGNLFIPKDVLSNMGFDELLKNNGNHLRCFFKKIFINNSGQRVASAFGQIIDVAKKNEDRFGDCWQGIITHYDHGTAFEKVTVSFLIKKYGTSVIEYIQDVINKNGVMNDIFSLLDNGYYDDVKKVFDEHSDMVNDALFTPAIYYELFSRKRYEDWVAILSSGYNPNFKDCINTPLLHAAVYRGDSSAVKALVEYGADCFVQSRQNQSIFDMLTKHELYNQSKKIKFLRALLEGCESRIKMLKQRSEQCDALEQLRQKTDEFLQKRVVKG